MTSSLLPTSWRPSPAALLPANPALYDGPRLATWAAMIYLVFITVRSLIHLLSPDGGAQSIATIDVHVASGANIVAMFGQWGAIQLLLAGPAVGPAAALAWARAPGAAGVRDRALPAQPVRTPETRHGDGHAAGRGAQLVGFPGARAAAVDVALPGQAVSRAGDPHKPLLIEAGARIGRCRSNRGHSPVMRPPVRQRRSMSRAACFRLGR